LSSKLSKPLCNGTSGYAEYVYNATFPDISLTPGTTYWFEITGTIGTGDFGVETTSDAPAGAQACQNLGSGPVPIVAQLAISLTVPEPSTWAMMLVGFAGLGFVGYRRNLRARAAA
jgi:hypothetical protein